MTNEMKILREIRDSLLQSTENKGYGLADRPFSDALLLYRQNLRDLPTNCDPVLNEFGGVDNVEFPEPPPELLT